MYIAVNTIWHHSASIQCRATMVPPTTCTLPLMSYRTTQPSYNVGPLSVHQRFSIQIEITGEPLTRYCMLTGYFLLQTERLVGEDETGRNNLQRTSSGIYTRVPSSNIYIFSVVAINSTEEHVWDIFTVNVWTYQYISSNSLWCCFLYKRDVVMRKGSLTFMPRAEAQT